MENYQLKKNLSIMYTKVNRFYRKLILISKLLYV